MTKVKEDAPATQTDGAGAGGKLPPSAPTAPASGGGRLTPEQEKAMADAAAAAENALHGPKRK
jgi:hypothetical protein